MLTEVMGEQGEGDIEDDAEHGDTVFSRLVKVRTRAKLSEARYMTWVGR